MTERLTEHGFCAGEPCGDNCYDCDHFGKILEKLSHYEDLEEQGRLFILPCKIGDTLWQVIRSGFHCNYIQPIKLDYKNFYQMATGAGFGKTIFLTKEEAEAALKEK